MLISYRKEILICGLNLACFRKLQAPSLGCWHGGGMRSGSNQGLSARKLGNKKYLSLFVNIFKLAFRNPLDKCISFVHLGWISEMIPWRHQVLASHDCTSPWLTDQMNKESKALFAFACRLKRGMSELPSSLVDWALPSHLPPSSRVELLSALKARQELHNACMLHL